MDAADASGPLVLNADAQTRFQALKLWRAAVAREHNLPAYVVFHDATLAQMAGLVAMPLIAQLAIVHQGWRASQAINSSSG